VPLSFFIPLASFLSKDKTVDLSPPYIALFLVVGVPVIIHLFIIKSMLLSSSSCC